jgi:DNA-nicking Smr family endonuclease
VAAWRRWQGAAGGERSRSGKSVGIRVHPWLTSRVDDEPIQLPMDGVLDLHTFQPREVKSLVREYLAECRARGILHVRIIHGKGIGQLRQTVHAILRKHPDVMEFHLAAEQFGGWGATIVLLTPDNSKR